MPDFRSCGLNAAAFVTRLNDLLVTLAEEPGGQAR
jgi:hypothetical protein